MFSCWLPRLDCFIISLLILSLIFTLGLLAGRSAWVTQAARSAGWQPTERGNLNRALSMVGRNSPNGLGVGISNSLKHALYHVTSSSDYIGLHFYWMKHLNINLYYQFCQRMLFIPLTIGHFVSFATDFHAGGASMLVASSCLECVHNYFSWKQKKKQHSSQPN